MPYILEFIFALVSFLTPWGKQQFFKFAVENGDTKNVDMLIKDGVDVNTKGYYAETPLYIAACHGHTEIVRMLIENGAYLNARTDYDDATPVYIATCHRHTEIVRMFIENGADLDIQNVDTYTPLSASRYYGHTEIFTMLQNAHKIDDFLSGSRSD
jgi:uncharacterized protein